MVVLRSARIDYVRRKGATRRADFLFFTSTHKIVPIIVGVLAGFVEWWMRNLDKDIAGLEKKKYAAKGV